jgi:hypothetical protein
MLTHEIQTTFKLCNRLFHNITYVYCLKKSGFTTCIGKNAPTNVLGASMLPHQILSKAMAFGGKDIPAKMVRLAKSQSLG